MYSLPGTILGAETFVLRKPRLQMGQDHSAVISRSNLQKKTQVLYFKYQIESKAISKLLHSTHAYAVITKF